MDRRALIKGSARAVAGLTAAAPFGLARLLAPEASAAPSTRLKPPGALADDSAFTAACIGCGLCGEVCPPRCIRFYQRDGGDAANTPYIDPRAKSCTLCGKCMEVCPCDALGVIPLTEIDMGIAQIDRNACYPWVDRGVCGACVVVCPLGERAISFEFATFYRPIVQDGCIGCGQCVEVCPEPSLHIRIVARPKGSVAPHGRVTQSAGA